MSLMNNRYFIAFVIAAVFIAGGYLCTVSVVWMATFCAVAPMALRYILQRFGTDRDYSDEFEDPDWHFGKY